MFILSKNLENPTNLASFSKNLVYENLKIFGQNEHILGYYYGIMSRICTTREVFFK